MPLRGHFYFMGLLFLMREFLILPTVTRVLMFLLYYVHEEAPPWVGYIS